jgi:hypothetical protein
VLEDSELLGLVLLSFLISRFVNHFQLLVSELESLEYLCEQKVILLPDTVLHEVAEIQQIVAEVYQGHLNVHQLLWI